MKALAIVGGAGRMGQALAEGLGAREEFDVVALVDRHEPRERFGARFAHSLDELDVALDAVVDFSTPEGVGASARFCRARGVALVVGATGLGEAERAELETTGSAVGVVVASNFSIGAVLAERFAAMAAPFFSSAEVIELHHERKVDAPSGTSLAVARAIARARASAGRSELVDPTTRHSVEGSRGAAVEGGVRVHAIRLPGLLAHEEIHFGSSGEGLTIRHDSFDRQSFVHGVALALLAVDTTPCFIEGVASLLGESTLSNLD